MRLISHIALALACLVLPVHAAEPYPLFYDTARPFMPAILNAEKNIKPLEQSVTGVTVPHHLLAADMIGSTLRLACGRKYQRILIISPDHFRRGKTLCSTTTRPFVTPLGDVAIDETAIRDLIDGALVSESSLFSHEHGIQAILPFIARWFPDTPVIPLVLDIRSRPQSWPALAAKIKPLVTPDTLIIQSTDFSHYLLQKVAAVKDQETLHVLACGDSAAIPDLGQPDHLDSKASQWLHMTLEREVYGIAAPVVVDNRNAIRYGGRPDEPRTTSYITQVYSKQFIPAAALPGEAWFFGGDTHFGRHIATAPPERLKRMDDAILGVTGSRPLIVNLEGVVLDEAPSGYQHPMRIGMEAERTIAALKRLNVVAVSVANNHSLDYGKQARAHMIDLLSKSNITVIDEGPPVGIGPFRLGVATDVVNLPEPANKLLTESSFESWKVEAPAKPLFAFLHAGIEYRDAPGTRERQLADWAEKAGASLVIGCHPHRPSTGWERSTASLRFPSMGNLIFDQTDPKNGGGLVEIRFFEQGTWAARWLALGNLYAEKK